MVEFVAKITANPEYSFDNRWYVVKMDKTSFDIVSLDSYSLSIIGDKKLEQDSISKLLNDLRAFNEQVDSQKIGDTVQE